MTPIMVRQPLSLPLYATLPPLAMVRLAAALMLAAFTVAGLQRVRAVAARPGVLHARHRHRPLPQAGRQPSCVAHASRRYLLMEHVFARLRFPCCRRTTITRWHPRPAAQGCTRMPSRRVRLHPHALRVLDLFASVLMPLRCVGSFMPLRCVGCGMRRVADPAAQPYSNPARDWMPLPALYLTLFVVFKLAWRCWLGG